jgi:hypothetical protein
LMWARTGAPFLARSLREKWGFPIEQTHHSLEAERSFQSDQLPRTTFTCSGISPQNRNAARKGRAYFYHHFHNATLTSPKSTKKAKINATQFPFRNSFQHKMHCHPERSMPVSKANRHAQSKDPVFLDSATNPAATVEERPFMAASRHHQNKEGFSPVVALRPQIPQQLLKLSNIQIIFLPLAEVRDVVLPNLRRQILSLVAVKQRPLPQRLIRSQPDGKQHALLLRHFPPARVADFRLHPLARHAVRRQDQQHPLIPPDRLISLLMHFLPALHVMRGKTSRAHLCADVILRRCSGNLMTTLNIHNLGQIKDAALSFGDLTVFVGPQASGKSIALQLLKLLLDTGQVQGEMRRHGLDWGRKLPDFLDTYFGEGMKSIWKDGSTSIKWKGKRVHLPRIANRMYRGKHETLFFIPAQRVLALREGWPRPFTDYAPGDPFAVREFSEKLRLLVEQEFDSTSSLFPQERRLKKEFRDLLQRQVFSTFHLSIDKVRSQKRLVLGTRGADGLPYMVWSAGQREFVPLLLGLYWLMPRTQVATRDHIKWVVLEELEMGLHPRAISVVVLLVLELLFRGYRVCLSTHSPQILDAIWAIKHLRANKADANSLLDVFDSARTHAMRKIAESVMDKEINVFYFDRKSGRTKDISDLDPQAEDEGTSGWGGLSEFSGRANRAVARSAAKLYSEQAS